jgi:hypothetical protein
LKFVAAQSFVRQRGRACAEPVEVMPRLLHVKIFIADYLQFTVYKIISTWTVEGVGWKRRIPILGTGIIAAGQSWIPGE